MSESQVPQSGPSGFQEPEASDYQALSALAVLGLLSGIAGLAAVLWAELWIIPVIGAVISLVALGRIARYSPALTGRMVAAVGLILSVFSAAAVPANRIGYQRLICREAQEFAAIWFESLRENEPVKAYQLTQDPRYRWPLAEFSQKCLDEESEYHESMIGYTGDKWVGKLLELGDKARDEHHSTVAHFQTSDGDSVVDTYAITYDEDGASKTAYVKLTLNRWVLPGTDQSDWQLKAVKAVEPE